MAILKNKTQGNYTVVSQNIMRDRNLSLTERGMLLTLLSLPDNWNLTMPQCMWAGRKAGRYSVRQKKYGMSFRKQVKHSVLCLCALSFLPPRTRSGRRENDSRKSSWNGIEPVAGSMQPTSDIDLHHLRLFRKSLLRKVGHLAVFTDSDFP